MAGDDGEAQAHKRPEPSEEDFLLKPYGGERPPAPGWFTEAISTPFRTHSVTVRGVEITYQSWGDTAKPGLLLVHGNGAHSHWWDFIAPFLAEDYHVVAANFSGMGDSGWRDTYEFTVFAEEQAAVCEDAGFFDHAVKPIVVAHSFGGIIALFLSALCGEEFAGMIMVDSRIQPSDDSRKGPPTRSRPNRIYPDVESALARFRLAPLQPCENHFAVDYIARHSLMETTGEDGEAGFTWKFDPFIFQKLKPRWQEIGRTHYNPKCPLLFMRGADSILVTPEVAKAMQALQDPPPPVVTIPQAQHHVMLDQPLAFVSAVRGVLAGWPQA